MIRLDQLSNATRPRKKRKTVGRGIGSGVGKTCGRGVKGAGARSGYKRRHGTEGGGVALYRRLPTRGFTNRRFQTKLDFINLSEIEKLYNDGETVSVDTLREKGFLKGPSYGVKVLGNGKLTKRLKFEVEAFSEKAKREIENLVK